MMIAQFVLCPRLGMERCGKRNAVNSLSDMCTGIGVVAGFCTLMLIMSGPHMRNGAMNWRIKLLEILQRLRNVFKTRNQLQCWTHPKNA